MLHSGIDRSPVSRVAGLATAAALVLLTIPLAGLTASLAAVPPVSLSAGRDVVIAASTPPGIPAPPASPAAPEATAAPHTAAAAPQAAPTGPTSLSGTVYDPTGRAMPDVVVDISQPSAPTGPRPQLRTGTDGRFEITGLSPGEYEVSSSKPGFRRNRLIVSLQPGTPKTLKVVMPLGSLAEMIVIAPSPSSGPTTAPAPKRLAEGLPRPDPCDNSPVGGCVTPPRKLVDMKPAYPPALAATGVSATVVVQATLGIDGFLEDFQFEVGADTAFVQAVLDALRQWQFSPAKLNGTPQECQITVTARFEPGKN